MRVLGMRKGDVIGQLLGDDMMGSAFMIEPWAFVLYIKGR